ncbi:MAG: HRDC domain-containing protein, partial [Sulfurimonadaceae bacterium]
LRGSKEQKLLANEADKLSVYAIGTHLSKKEWFVVLERILELKILTNGEFSTLKLTNEAVEVLKGRQEVFIKSSRLQVESKEKKVKQNETLNYDKELFERLRAKRLELAEELGVPPYIIFTDRTLKHLAEERPTDKRGMLAINGIGEKKFEQYGEEFLELLHTFA